MEGEHSHQRLFQQSLVWSENEMLERSLTQTSALLAHCFYFLATSQYERHVIPSSSMDILPQVNGPSDVGFHWDSQYAWGKA